MDPRISILVLALFFAWVLWSMFYAQVVKPVLRDALRFKLFALRDELRRLAVSGEIPSSSFNYSYLERMLCRLIDRSPWYSWASIFEFSLRYKNAGFPVEAQRFQEKAPQILKEICTKTIQLMFLIVVVNSPMITLALLVMLLSVGFALKTFKRWIEWIECKVKICLQEPLEVYDPAWPRIIRV